MINYLEVSGEHDLLAVQYAGDTNLYLYSFEKGKISTFLTYPDLIKIMFIPGFQIFVILTQKKLEVMSFKKSITSSSMTFFLHYSIDLWNVEDILTLGVPKRNSKV